LKNTKQITYQARNEGRKALLEPEAKNICMEYNIPVTLFEVAKNEEKAVELSRQIGFPVVLKVVSPDIIHKSDVGGVIINLKNEAEVRIAYRKILKKIKTLSPEAKIVGILVQKMAPQSTEVIVGAIKDPQFGQTLMFGLGGIFVELLKDVTFRVAPITREDASEMIKKVKAFPLLNGYRNTPPADLTAIINVLLNASRLVMDHPEIKELDLNPIMTYETGAITVDARIILE
jgi:acetyl-CoA synthetase (ADP-forming)